MVAAVAAAAAAVVVVVWWLKLSPGNRTRVEFASQRSRPRRKFC